MRTDTGLLWPLLRTPAEARHVDQAAMLDHLVPPRSALLSMWSQELKETPR